MNRIERLILAGLWSVAAATVVGCGAGGDGVEAPTAHAAEPTSEAQSPERAADGPVAEAAPTEVALQAATIEVAAPTPEQIAQWTPAPFEPVELLAIREWEKTSFTSKLAAVPGGKHFLVAGSRVVLWSISGDEPEHVFLELTGADGDRRILSLAVAPDGKWFAVGDSNGVVRIWTLDDRKEVISKEIDTGGITCIAISPDGQEIAAISYDSEVQVWSADGLRALHSFKVDSSGLNQIAYVAPGQLAAAGETTTLWDTKVGTLIKELSPDRYSFALARSTDGTRFIFGGDDSLHIWNVAESKTETTITRGATGSELISFSPDGRLLATTNGGDVRLWNLAEGRTVQIIDSFGWPIVGVSWLPETNLLAVASDIGCTRIWGTRSQGAAVGLTPLHTRIALPTAESKAPAAQDQLAQVIDLRILPQLPGSEPNMSSPAHFGCTAAVTVAEAQTFYRYFLEQAGWAAAPIDPINPAAMEFRKDGCRLNVSCYDGGDGRTSIMVDHAGNFDMRWAPRFDAAPVEVTYESGDTVMYRTKADLLSIETALLRQFHTAGWAGYSRLKSSHSEVADQRDMTFLRNGTTLRVSIGKFPVDPESYTIQYSVFPNNSWAPVPPDAGFVEFDGSTDPTLVATTAMSLDATRAFYERELSTQGWLIRDHGCSEKGDQCWLKSLREQSDLTVGLTKLPDGRTLVQIGDTGGSMWELSQAEEEPPGDEPAVGLQAADLPVLNELQTATYDALGESIEVHIDKSTLAAAAEQYTLAFEKLGWKPEEGGIRSEDYTFVTFEKGEQEIALRARLTDGKAVLNFQGSGLLWTKALPNSKQVVSFETWLRLNKHPAGLEQLEAYEAAMRTIQAETNP